MKLFRISINAKLYKFFKIFAVHLRLILEKLIFDLLPPTCDRVDLRLGSCKHRCRSEARV